MNIVIQRLIQNHNSTVGAMFIDNQLFGYTLEPRSQPEKIPGITRIPAGSYQVKFTKDTPMTNRYFEKFGLRGIPELQEVPGGFRQIYIHIGNFFSDTQGCFLIGSTANLVKDSTDNSQEYTVLNSTATYKILHEKIEKEIEKCNKVWCNVLNEVAVWN